MRGIHPAIGLLRRRVSGVGLGCRLIVDRYGHVILVFQDRYGKVIHVVLFFDSFRNAKHTPATVKSLEKAILNALNRYFPKPISEDWQWTLVLLIGRGTRGVKQLIKLRKPLVHIIEKTWLFKKGIRLYNYIANTIMNLLEHRIKAIKEALKARGIDQAWGYVKDLIEDLKLMYQAISMETLPETL